MPTEYSLERGEARTLLLSGLVAGVVSALVTVSALTMMADGEETTALPESGLQERVAELEARLEDREATPRRASTMATDGRPQPIDLDDLARRVADRLSAVGANSPTESKEGHGAVEPGIDPAKLAELKETLLDGGTLASERMAALRELSKAGLLGDVIALLEEAAGENPNDADVHFLLGSSYVSKIRSENLTAQDSAQFYPAARTALDRSLELNEQHIDARFTRAMLNTFSPESMGLRPAALKDLETLRDQQRDLPPSPKEATTLIFLGSQYLKDGRVEDARATWQNALKRFPDDPRLKKRLASLN